MTLGTIFVNHCPSKRNFTGRKKNYGEKNVKFQWKVVVHEAVTVGAGGGEEQPWETECRVANAYYISHFFCTF